MAFCKYCGKELTEGEICTCQQANPNIVFDNNTRQSDNYQQNNSFQSSKIYEQASVLKEKASTLDFKSFADFIKLYFKAPDEAARLGAKANDKLSLVICSVVFLFANAFAQLGLVLKLSLFGYGFGNTKAFVFFFGFVYALFGIFVPPALNILNASIMKTNIGKRNLFRENILHTPFTSIALLMSFVFGIFSSTLSVIFLIIAALIYIVSMCSQIAESLGNNDTIIKKVLLIGNIVIFIILFIVLILIEFLCAGEALSNIISQVF